MKKIYPPKMVLFFAASTMLTLFAAAQGGVYFREGFATGSGWPTSSSTALVQNPKGPMNVTVASGVWTTFGAYVSSGPTGSCTAATGDPYHVRFGNLSSVPLTPPYSNITDSAFLITPEVSAGIYSLTYYNGRAGRVLFVYKTYDSDPLTANWALVQQTTNTYTACDQFTISVNDASAKRLKITARSGTDSDLDSFVMTSVAPLPSKLGAMNAQWKKDGVQVSWEASNEINVKGYYVQRSDDGGNTFKDISFVPSLNRLTGTYTYNDKSAGTGLVFYRIKGQDLDGRTNIGKIVKLHLNKTEAEGVWVVNPVSGRTIEMQLNNLPKGVYSMQVLNAAGKVVAAKTVNVQSEKMSAILPLGNNAARGFYIVSIKGASLITNKRVVVE